MPDRRPSSRSRRSSRSSKRSSKSQRRTASTRRGSSSRTSQRREVELCKQYEAMKQEKEASSRRHWTVVDSLQTTLLVLQVLLIFAVVGMSVCTYLQIEVDKDIVFYFAQFCFEMLLYVWIAFLFYRKSKARRELLVAFLVAVVFWDGYLFAVNFEMDPISRICQNKWNADCFHFVKSSYHLVYMSMVCFLAHVIGLFASVSILEHNSQAERDQLDAQYMALAIAEEERHRARHRTGRKTSRSSSKGSRKSQNV